MLGLGILPGEWKFGAEALCKIRGEGFDPRTGRCIDLSAPSEPTFGPRPEVEERCMAAGGTWVGDKCAMKVVTCKAGLFWSSEKNRCLPILGDPGRPEVPFGPKWLPWALLGGIGAFVVVDLLLRRPY